jgi:hypothetical protein
MIKIFYQLLMWFWPVNEMTELVSGIPAPQFRDESSWMRDQSWFKVQAIPVFRFDWRKILSRTRGVVIPQVEDHSLSLVPSGHLCHSLCCYTVDAWLILLSLTDSLYCWCLADIAVSYSLIILLMLGWHCCLLLTHYTVDAWLILLSLTDSKWSERYE